MTSRRIFIEKTAMSVIGAAGLPLIGSAAASAISFKKETRLPIGVAGYTFAKVDIEKSIAMMKRLDIHYLSLKDIHLPLNSNGETIKNVLTQFSNAAIKVYAAGVIYMKTKQAVDEAFAYAKKAGADMIVGVPNYDLLDYVEEKVKAGNIRIAIHNHGPEDALYPGPQDVYNRIKNRDSRMGLCMDIGHATRAGANIETSVNNFKERLFDLHIKDVATAAKDAKAIEIGRGVIDFKALVAALYKINYKGICSIEYEKDMTDPLPGLAESTGFFRGILACHG